MFGDQKAIKPWLVTNHVDVALSGQTVSDVFQQTKCSTIFGEMLVSFAVVFGDVTQRSLKETLAGALRDVPKNGCGGHQ